MPLAPLQELQLLAVSVNGLELETIDQRLKRHVSAIGSVSGKGSCCSTQKLSKENSENHEENENMQQIHRSCTDAFDECPDCVKSNSDFAEELQCMIKEGYDAQANQYGYVNVTDMKAMGKLAEFLTLEPDVVSKEMKALDFDANNLVSFAEFVLWADKHTIGIP
ncbi:unnamed protein product, partial [Cladocopium goreaui]